MNRRNFITLTSALAGTSSLLASAFAFEGVSPTNPVDEPAQSTDIGTPVPSKLIFTLEEVKSLNAYQRSGVRHPYTCGWNHRDENHLDGEGLLVATEGGWICPYCNYRQDGAPDWMKNWKWKEMFRISPYAEPEESDWSERVAVSIAIAAAKNCLAVFEDQYPGDDRPRKALEAAEQWLKDPTMGNRRAAERLETGVWRAGRTNWKDQAGAAADACGYAARALRHPYSSASSAIRSDRFANRRDWDYVSEWLWKLVRELERSPWRECKIRMLAYRRPPDSTLANKKRIW